MSAGSRMTTLRPCDSSEGARSPVVVMNTTSGWNETIFSALGVATAAVLVAGAAAPQAETTERKAMRRIAKNAGRRVIRRTPFSRRRVGREREARRPEFYGRGTLPESH